MMWFFQCRCLFIDSPRNIKLSTNSILVSFICKLGGIMFFCGIRKSMALVFLTFNDSLFIFNHSVMFFNSLFMLFTF